MSISFVLPVPDGPARVTGMQKKMSAYVAAVVLVLSQLAKIAGEQKEWMLPNYGSLFHADQGRYTDLALGFESRIKLVKDYELQRHPVLGLQFLTKQPKFWIMQTLSGKVDDRTNVAYRSDNLYLSGFTNRMGWVGFKDGKKYTIPGSATLKFGSDYKDLVGEREDGAWRNLVGLDVSRNSITGSISVMRNCNPGKTPDKAIKLAVTKVTVVTVEVIRFPYIRDFVNKAWTVSGAPTELDERAARLIVNWKTISCAILIWAIDEKRWDSEEAIELAKPHPYGLGIATVEEAKATIFPVLQSTTCSVPYGEYKHK